MKQKFNRICVTTVIVILFCVVICAITGCNKAPKEEQIDTEASAESVVATETVQDNQLVESVVQESTEPLEEGPSLIYCDQVIDFVELQKENPDIYAWIQIPGTVIDYPVLQSEEDNYYLNRNQDYSTGYPGCIYTNKCNTKDFSDALTVMYGHNMKNGTMFAGLHKFEDADFFNENCQILIYTENARYIYQVYMAAAYNDYYIPAMFDVTSGKDAVRFCDDLKAYDDNRKLAQENEEVSEEDCFLVLSTCIAREGTKRYLVVGKLVETAVYP